METHRKRALIETGAFTMAITSGLWLSIVSIVPSLVLIAAGVTLFVLAFRETCIVERSQDASKDPSDKAFGLAFTALLLMSIAAIGAFAVITTALQIPGSVQLP